MTRYEEAIANGETTMDGWTDVGQSHPKALWYAYHPDGFKVTAIDARSLAYKMYAANWGVTMVIQQGMFHDREPS